jgi:phospholipid/cholesterol/gamma-HCH transport system substrate-binding protein
MNDQAMKFRLGVFVLGAAILLAILIILFGRAPMVFTRQVEYYVTLTQAPGVQPGTPVRKSGVKIGEVESVDLQPETGQVTVQIAVDRKYQLLQGDVATLGRSLLGDTSINFVLEGDNRELAPSGFVYQGKLDPDLAAALRKATDLVGITESTLEEIRSAAKAINTSIPDVRRTNSEIQIAASNFARAAEGIDNMVRGNQDRLVKAIDAFVDAAGKTANVLSDENQRNLSVALQNIRNASGRFEQVMQDTEVLVKETQKTVKVVGERVDVAGKSADEFFTEATKTVKNVGDRIDTVGKNAETLMTESRQTMKIVGERVDSVGRNADELIKESRVTVRRVNDSLSRTDEVLANLQQATKPLAERAPSVMKNLDESTARLNLITYNVGEFTRGLNQGDGTLRRLIMDPSLYQSIDDLAKNLNKSACRFDNILRDLELFADKVARHPELLGVSGAVSPSSGIKR